MKIFITGATGMVGGELVPALHERGHQLCAWVRSVGAAREKLHRDVRLIATDRGPEALRDGIDGADAVINLAGENLFAGRWTERRKRELRDSRVELTEAIARAVRDAERPPAVILSASAIGYYGAEADEVDEEDGPGSDFLADLCVAWERAAEQAEGPGTRVTRLRIGIVLGRQDSALQKMAAPIRMGIGGRLGSGRQPVSWVHVDDLVGVVLFALDTPEAAGALNVTAPKPVSNAELTRAIGRHLGRSTPFAAPAFALRLALGEAATALLEGARVMPRRLEQLGYRHRFSTVDRALDDLL